MGFEGGGVGGVSAKQIEVMDGLPMKAAESLDRVLS